MKISVIIPTFNEQDRINEIIEDIKQKSENFEIEIIISDASPNQKTLTSITHSNIKKVPSEKGRGTQLNTGVENSAGNVLFFLHADTKLPKNAFSQINKTIKKYPAGAFKFGIENAGFGLKIIEFFVNLRNLITSAPYGDQGLFITREFFREIGGFKDIPLMEDLDIIKRIQRKNFKILSEKILTSDRRYKKHGIIKTTLKNLYIRTLYSLDRDPKELYKIYYGTKI